MQGDPPPLEFDVPLMLVGGAPLPDGALEEAAALTDATVAADGGADRLAAAGREPYAVIGDMDSVADSAAWRDRIGDRFVHVAEQDSTDLQKCLRLTRAPLTVGVGFLDGRLDHTLAALSALALAAPRPVILLGGEDVAAALPPRWSMQARIGMRVSLFPMGPARVLSSSGLRWPAEGLDMAPAGRIGTSNEASGERVAVSAEGTPLVAILPRVALPALAESLRVPV